MSTKHHPSALHEGTNAERLAYATHLLVPGMMWVETDTQDIYVWDGLAWDGPFGAGGAHNLLSATHPDTNVAGVVRADIVIGDATPEWARLAKGNAADVLRINAAGADVAWEALFDAVVPNIIQADDAAFAGVAVVAAMRDHEHGFPCGIPVDTGTANAEGILYDFVRSDHIHKLHDHLHAGVAGDGGKIPVTSLFGYVRGRIFRGGAVAWETYDAKTLHNVLEGDGTDIISTSTTDGQAANKVVRTDANKAMRPFRLGLHAAPPDQDGAMALAETADPTNVAGVGMLYTKDAAGVTRLYFMRDDGTVIDVRDHGNLDGLADDDHAQYLLASGARALSGAWDVGAHLVTFGAGIAFDGATGVNVITIPDNLADALHIVDAGDANDYLTFVTANAQREVVFNQNGANIDFRIEGDTVTNLFFVDASTDRIGIKKTPLTDLDIAGKIRTTASSTPATGVGMEMSWDGTYGDILSYNRNTSAYQAFRFRGSTIRIRGGGVSYGIHVAANGDVGVGGLPGQIFDVQVLSGNMIADGYDVHSLAKWKDGLRDVDVDGMLLKVLAVIPQQWKRIPFVSADELVLAAWEHFGIKPNDSPPDPGRYFENLKDGKILSWIDAKREELRAQRKPLPEWQRLHYGLVADDPTTNSYLSEVVSRSHETNEPCGISLSNYVGVLHAAIIALSRQIEELRR